MSTKDEKKKIGDFEVHTIRKDIKNIHLGVYPPDGKVRVAAPTKTTDDTIKVLVSLKTPWIRKQQAKFREQERQTKRQFVSGESHFFLGKRYLLNVINTSSRAKVEINNANHIDLYINPKASTEKREKVMNNFYRQELKKLLQNLISKWEKTTKTNVKEFRIKKMKTKWGTCSQKHQRIWLNLELAKKPIHCIEYIVVHELIHLIEKNHTPKFKTLLDSVMPQWPQYKEELNRSTLSHSKWENMTA